MLLPPLPPHFLFQMIQWKYRNAYVEHFPGGIREEGLNISKYGLEKYCIGLKAEKKGLNLKPPEKKKA